MPGVTQDAAVIASGHDTSRVWPGSQCDLRDLHSCGRQISTGVFDQITGNYVQLVVFVMYSLYRFIWYTGLQSNVLPVRVFSN